ncbi:hypothetical protein GCM10027405_31480 [Arthrobacter alkaliphilus]|uniref:hypothetical protein n=1 Tax=Arthrobacter alkaliphilus TaxID=369936 RepID=UPI001F3F7A45|nr:hypothetical protein [Arthrobacter alkaliphilus]
MLKNDDLADGVPFKGRSIARDYVYCVHPETGLEVVFVPAEALPDFAAAVQEANGQGNSELVASETKPVAPKGNRPVRDG